MVEITKPCPCGKAMRLEEVLPSDTTLIAKGFSVGAHVLQCTCGRPPEPPYTPEDER